MNKFQGKAQLREQLGGKGYFAVVSVEAELFEGSLEPVIHFGDSVETQWREAAIVGVRLAWRYLPKKHTHRKSASILVETIDWQPGDTTEIVVMYVVARAVLGAFDANPENGPAFILPFGAFVFAK